MTRDFTAVRPQRAQQRSLCHFRFFIPFSSLQRGTAAPERTALVAESSFDVLKSKQGQSRGIRAV